MCCAPGVPRRWHHLPRHRGPGRQRRSGRRPDGSGQQDLPPQHPAPACLPGATGAGLQPLPLLGHHQQLRQDGPEGGCVRRRHGAAARRSVSLGATPTPHPPTRAAPGTRGWTGGLLCSVVCVPGRGVTQRIHGEGLVRNHDPGGGKSGAWAMGRPSAASGVRSPVPLCGREARSPVGWLPSALSAAFEPGLPSCSCHLRSCRWGGDLTCPGHLRGVCWLLRQGSFPSYGLGN